MLTNSITVIAVLIIAFIFYKFSKKIKFLQSDNYEFEEANKCLVRESDMFRDKLELSQLDLQHSQSDVNKYRQLNENSKRQESKLSDEVIRVGKILKKSEEASLRAKSEAKVKTIKLKKLTADFEAFKSTQSEILDKNNILIERSNKLEIENSSLREELDSLKIVKPRTVRRAPRSTTSRRKSKDS